MTIVLKHSSAVTPFSSPWMKRVPHSGRLLRIVGIAFLLRTLVSLCVYQFIAAPTAAHAEFGAEMGWVARSLALHHGFASPFLPETGSTALVPPLYPFLLAGAFRSFGLYSSSAAIAILLFNNAVSSLTCIPIFFATRRLFEERAACLASWLWVIYPLSIYFAAARVWDYALTSFLFACCFSLALRLRDRASLPSWLWFGLLAGLSCLSNPAVLPALVLLLALACIGNYRHLSGNLLRGGIATAGLLLVLVPWLLRNQRVLHINVPVRDGFWLEFQAGNHGDVFSSNPASAHPASDSSQMTAYLRLGETAYLAEKRRDGLDYVSHHLLRFLRVCLRRALSFWTGFWSLDPLYLREEPLEVPATLLLTALLLLMMLGLWTQRSAGRRRLEPYLVLLLLFPLPYYVTHSSPDYRQPIEPEVIALVALGLRRSKNILLSRFLYPSSSPANLILKEPRDVCEPVLRRI